MAPNYLAHSAFPLLELHSIHSKVVILVCRHENCHIMPNSHHGQYMATLTIICCCGRPLNEVVPQTKYPYSSLEEARSGMDASPKLKALLKVRLKRDQTASLKMHRKGPQIFTGGETF
jgi:hypothetical protein